MAEIHEYHHVAFNSGVQPTGMAKLIKITATGGVRIFRDMADPDTLVITHANPPRRDEVPWGNVQVARCVKKAEPVKEPEPAMQQGQSQKGGK